ncbi:MAG: cellulase family glycosylhydrolase [Clostridia bacterium]|nr:cellulase family glycosylhydrolase [Clostridia bacterium]
MMNNVWTKEKAWEWYNSRPWMRGCNFMGSDCANRIDQWQSYGFEERLETARKELALAAETGFNTIRIILEYEVWEQEHDTFFDRFDRYLDAAYEQGITAIVVLGNDCMRPKGPDWKRDTLGEQHYDWGYHGGRKVSQHGTYSDAGYHLMDEPELALRHYEMVREVVERYKDDKRISMWDVYNEVGMSNRKNMSMPHLKKFFEIIRAINPSQPLTCCVWSIPDLDDLDSISEVQKFGLENSDIISYHNYQSYEENVRIIKLLKKLGRPIINTEWLARCLHNTVEQMFPLFYLERIGCTCWGFVAGKYQTYEPWNCIWDQYEENPDLDWDFTKWFHDLYRPNYRPYNPKETELIKRFCEYADNEFNK